MGQCVSFLAPGQGAEAEHSEDLPHPPLLSPEALRASNGPLLTPPTGFQGSLVQRVAVGALHGTVLQPRIAPPLGRQQAELQPAATPATPSQEARAQEGGGAGQQSVAVALLAAASPTPPMQEGMGWEGSPGQRTMTDPGLAEPQPPAQEAPSDQQRNGGAKQQQHARDPEPKALAPPTQEARGQQGRPHSERRRVTVEALPAAPPTPQAQEARGQLGASSQRRVMAQPLPSAGRPEAGANAPGGGPAGGSPNTAANALSPVVQQPPTQDWLAGMVGAIWPYARKAFEKLAWESIPGILEASRPSWVHGITLQKFELGETPPKVTNVRMQSSRSPLSDEVFLEMDFDWRSTQDVRIQIVVPRLPLLLSELIPDVLEEHLRLWLCLTVKIWDLSMRGSARLTLRPLWERLPLVGGLQLALVRIPQFDYQLSLGPLLAALLPLVHTWMDGAFKEMVLQSVTLPEHIFLQCAPEAPDVDSPEGVLVVRVQRAEHVPKMDLFGSSDPFVELYVRDAQRRRTAVRPRTRRPRWEESFALPVHVPEHQELTVILFDHDEWTPDDEIGRHTVPLRDLQPGRTQQLSLEIRSREELKHREQKEKEKGWRRLSLALGRPFTKQSFSASHLHLQVMYHPFSHQEAQVIGYSRQYGLQAALSSQAATSVDPSVLSMLHSGQLVLRRARGGDLALVAGLRSPYVRAVLRVGHLETASNGAKASRGGAVECPMPIVLNLGPEETQNPHAHVHIELQQDGWLGAKPRGRAVLRLQEVLAAGKVEGEHRLRWAARGRVQLCLEWKPYV